MLLGFQYFEFKLILCYQVVRKAYHVHSSWLYIYIVIKLIRRLVFQDILTLYNLNHVFMVAGSMD